MPCCAAMLFVMWCCCSNEPDCLTIGDGTVIDDLSFVMAHTTENRCVKFHGEQQHLVWCPCPLGTAMALQWPVAFVCRL
jgi:hypothetical protein